MYSVSLTIYNNGNRKEPAVNERQEKLIAFLEKEGTWIKGKDLALIMHVSTRTIRSDIEAINAQLKDGSIESSYQLGYRLHIRQTVPVAAEKVSVPQTPQERCGYILKKLLSVNEIHMTELSEEVCVSLYTIEQDVMTIRERELYDTNLQLVMRKGWLRLTGDEYDKRRLFKKLLMEEVKENFFNLDVVARLYPEFDLFRCKEILAGCMESRGFELRETEIPMLLMHIGVALKRMLQFQQYEISRDNPELEHTTEYMIADDLYERIGSMYGIDINKQEKAQLALLLLGKKAGQYSPNCQEFKGQLIDVQESTIELLGAIEERFGIQLRNDEDLIHGLSLHLKSLLARLENNTTIHNVYLDEIRRKFPLIYDMAVYGADRLQTLYGLEVNEDEIGFLALHFGAAYNKISRSKRYRAVMIFPDTQMLKNVIIEKIHAQFDERMNLTAILDTFEEKKVRDLHPDLILTSIPLTHSLAVPTLEISVFYTSQVEGAIFSLLNRMDKEKGRRDFEQQIRKLLMPEFFFHYAQASSAQEVIAKMCAPLVEKGYIPEAYYEAVVARESYAPTSFQAGFALPHALNSNALKSVIGVAFLDKPIQWGSYQVELVLLLAIREDDHELLSKFFDWWIQVISDDIRFNRLKHQKNYHTFMKVILEE